MCVMQCVKNIYIKKRVSELARDRIEYFQFGIMCNDRIECSIPRDGFVLNVVNVLPFFLRSLHQDAVFYAPMVHVVFCVANIFFLVLVLCDVDFYVCVYAGSGL